MIAQSLLSIGKHAAYISADNQFTALDPLTGEQLWSVASKGMPSTGIESNGIVCFTDVEGLYALNVSDGAKLWERKYDNVDSLAGTYSYEPTMNDELVYFYQRHSITALDAKTGKTIWEYSNEYFSSTVLPAFLDGNIYISTLGDNTSVIALDSSSGKLIRTIKTDIITKSLVVTPNYLLIGTYNGGILAFDMNSGAKKWGFNLESEQTVENTNISVNGNLVFLTNQKDGYINSIDLNTGKQIWNHKVASTEILGIIPFTNTSISIIGNILYIGSWASPTGIKGDLLALDLVSGEEKWRYSIEGGLMYNPIIFNGVIYVVSSQKLIALSSQNVKANEGNKDNDVSKDKNINAKEFVVNGIKLGDSKETLVKKLGIPVFKDEAEPFIRYGYGSVYYFLVDDKVAVVMSLDIEAKTKRGIGLDNIDQFNKAYSEFDVKSFDSNYRFIDDGKISLAANNYGKWIAIFTSKYIKQFSNSYFDVPQEPLYNDLPHSKKK